MNRDKWCWLSILLWTTLAPLCSAAAPPEELPMSPPPRTLSARRPSAEKISGWLKPLSQVSLEVDREGGPLPIDVSGAQFGPGIETERTRPPFHVWPTTMFHWEASNGFHQPLYFDDVPLERYGQTVCPLLQPALSGTKFLAAFPLMPYKLALDDTHDAVSTLGHYRPGSPTPCVRQRLPWEVDAASVETVSWLAAIAILP